MGGGNFPSCSEKDGTTICPKGDGIWLMTLSGCRSIEGDVGGDKGNNPGAPWVQERDV